MKLDPECSYKNSQINFMHGHIALKFKGIHYFTVTSF